MLIENLRIVSVEPRTVGPSGTFQVEVAFECSSEEAVSLSVSIFVGTSGLSGFISRGDTIEKEVNKGVSFPAGLSVYDEAFSFQLPASGLVDGNRFVEVSVVLIPTPFPGYRWYLREYGAVAFVGYSPPLNPIVGIIAAVAVGAMLVAMIVGMAVGKVKKK